MLLVKETASVVPRNISIMKYVHLSMQRRNHMFIFVQKILRETLLKCFLHQQMYLQQ